MAHNQPLSRVFDPRTATLGEGPLWHPERGELFWFDIIGKTLFSVLGNWTFDMQVSAAGWVDREILLIASERGLHRFDIASGDLSDLVALEADSPATRSNDGRADPWGGFWIGTMGKNADPGAGAIYRYYQGELRRLYAPLTIPNAICFSPDRKFAYFTDTPTRQIMRQPLRAADGWPDGDAKLHIDLRASGHFPDGAVVDADGNLWCAEWGSARVACYDPDGTYQRHITFAAPHTSCPGFGGTDLSQLFCTTARLDLDAAALERHPFSGCVFVADSGTHGQAEHRVRLP